GARAVAVAIGPAVPARIMDCGRSGKPAGADSSVSRNDGHARNKKPGKLPGFCVDGRGETTPPPLPPLVPGPDPRLHPHRSPRALDLVAGPWPGLLRFP